MSKTKSQPAVKIDGSLNDSLTEWLKTPYAKSLGFHSKSHFITNAVRDLMFKYRAPNLVDLVRYETHYELYDNSISKKIEVIINKSESGLECRTCTDSFRCDHVLNIWKIPMEIIHLEQLRFFNPFKYLFSKL